MEYTEIQSIDRKEGKKYFLYFMNYSAKGNSHPRESVVAISGKCSIISKVELV